MFKRHITVHLILFVLTIANAICASNLCALDFYPLRGESGELILGLGYPGLALLSPQGDRVITNSLVGYLLWVVTKNPPEPSLLLDKNSGYSPIQFLADGKQLAIRKENSFRIIDVASKNVLYENDSPDLRYAQVFSPDEKKVLTFYYNKVEVYDLESRKIVKTLTVPSLTDLTNGLFTGEMSVDNRWVSAVFSFNAQPIVWNYETGDVVRLFSKDYNDITFSKDGKWMATENIKTYQIQVFDVETGEAVYAFSAFADYPDGRHSLLRDFNDMKFSQANQNILIVSQSTGEIFFIDVTTGNISRLNTPDIGYSSVYFLTDANGKRLLIQYEDNIVHLWDVETGEENGSIDAFPRMFSKGIFSPDGKSVITGHWDTLSFFRTFKTVVDPEQYVYMHQWDAKTGQPFKSIIGHTVGVNKIVFTADGKNALSASAREFIFWDALSLTPIWSIPTYFNIPEEDLKSKYDWPGLPSSMSVALSTDEKTFVSIYRKEAILRDMDTKEIVQTFVGHPQMILDAAISPDGSLVATGGGMGDSSTGQTWDPTARIFDRQTGTELIRIQHGYPVASVQFSPDGQKLLTGSWDGTAALWDVKTGKHIQRFEHDCWVQKAVYTPDKKHILTLASEVWGSIKKSEIRIWDLEGNVVYSLKPYNTNSWDQFIDADLSPDQQRLLTISNDYAQIWDIPGVLPILTEVKDYAVLE